MDAIAGTIQGGEIVSRLIREEDLLLCLGFENTEEEREENVDDIITLEMIDSIPTAIDSYPNLRVAKDVPAARLPKTT